MSDEELPTNADGPLARGADTQIDQYGEVSLPSDELKREMTNVGYRERYERRGKLGKGGMGEVRLCFDRQMGREVALKVMLEEHLRFTTIRERFEREGRVQAQLEHPGIVPVYDLGMTPQGHPYLSMKRVRGITLQDVIRGLKKADPEMQQRYPRGALLSIIARVCETMAYAHARGVTHRDLKPANVMLGDFGEVNVLDWGLAKLDSDSDLSQPDSGGKEFTRVGAVIGTAGYMAPEQASGDNIDVRADVYSIGAMLFEVIVLERLHPEKEANQRIGSTIRGVDARPSQRIDGTPLELDLICTRACATLRDQRYPSALEVMEALRAYLDGAQITELRREIAGRHAAAARSSLVAPAATETQAVRVLRELGAAMVLDPNNTEMTAMIEQILSRTDEAPPREVIDEMEKQRNEAAVHAAGRSALAYLAGFVVLPVLIWMGVQNWLLFTFLGVALGTAVIGALAMWRSRRATGLVLWVTIPYAFGLVSLVSGIFGPFYLVPAVVVTTSVAFTISVRAPFKLRQLITACSLVAVFLPASLQWVGLLPSSYAFVDGRLHIVPQIALLPELPTTALMVVCTLFLILVGNLLVGRAVDSLHVAERKLFVQAHRLRAILPK